jgi:hypothetical protein
MKSASLYKITNTKNNLCYYGIVYGKNKTVEDRFTEHMNGKGGSLLYKHGVKVFGRDSFVVETILTGELDYIRSEEVALNEKNLWPNGYNGNTSHAIVLTEEQQAQIKQTKKQKWADNPETKPVPPNWKGKKRSDQMKERLSISKTGHDVSDITRQKLRDANVGKTQTEKTKEKRKQSLSANPNAYGREYWLAISPDGIGHLTHGGRNHMFSTIGISIGKSLFSNINTGNPTKCIAHNAKNNGWIFYNDYSKIKQVIDTLTEVKRYG